jgi:hypothetical protein
MRKWQSKKLQAYVDGLGGALPNPGPGGILLTACDDLYYVRYARTLLFSLEQQRSRQRMHVHLYAPGPETLADIDRLRLNFRHADVTYTIDSCELARGQPFPVMYYATARFLLASLLLERLRSPVLCLDVDAIVMRPVWDAYEPLQKAGDVGLIFRDHLKQPWRKILASAVGFNDTAGGRAFCSAVARALLSLLAYRPRYHIDQTMLHYASEAASRQEMATFFEIPMKFSDYEFRPESVIWTAKGRRKISPAFLERKNEIDEIYQHLVSDGAEYPGNKVNPLPGVSPI